MPQQWNRTYPLHWFEAFLSWAIIPFSRAKKIEVYATNGYYLMGIILLIMIFPLWVLGLLDLILSQLPASLRDIPGSALGPLGRKFLPESIPLIALLGLLYWVLFFIKRFRIFIGEAFAKLFFGTINVGIMAGEWCLEHRWWSLFVIIILVGVITRGTFYFIDARTQNARLEGEFNRWLEQVNYFCANSSLKWDRSAKYKDEVSPYWDGFPHIIGMPNNHPAFALHQMLDAFYLETQTPSLDNLQRDVDSYKSELQKMDPEKQHDWIQSWAWMNVLLGRKYAQECEKKDSYCKKASDSFGNVIALKQSTKIEDYQIAARNGRGTVYAAALVFLSQNPNSTVKNICPDATTCANNALDDYMQVSNLLSQLSRQPATHPREQMAASDSTCSFLGVRTENNKIDLLIRIGFYYNNLEKGRNINLTKICDGKSVANEADLATCIEARVKKVMDCSTNAEFITFTYITVAQAYAEIIALKLAADPTTDVSQKAEAAGNYLRLAYILNPNKRLEGKESEDFSYFRIFHDNFNYKSNCLSNHDNFNNELNRLSNKDNKARKDKKAQKEGQHRRSYRKSEYQCIFWDALTSGFDTSFKWENVDKEISDDLAGYNQK